MNEELYQMIRWYMEGYTDALGRALSPEDWNRAARLLMLTIKQMGGREFTLVEIEPYLERWRCE